MKMVITEYGTAKTILKFADHVVSMSVMVDDIGITANSEGKKIVPAGTIIGGGFISDNTVLAVKKNDADAEAVLLNDVDVTYGAAPGAAVLHGFINLNRLPEAPVAAAVTALAGRVMFLD